MTEAAVTRQAVYLAGVDGSPCREAGRVMSAVGTATPRLRPAPGQLSDLLRDCVADRASVRIRVITARAE